MIKPWLFCIFLFTTGMAAAQPYPFNGYTLYDYLVTATHPSGCPSNYVTGLPDDSTWVNMLDYSVMTGYFGYSWSDLPGNDLLLESSFHHDNYSVRLILEGGGFSSSFVVDQSMWTDLPFVNWTHIFPGCIPGSAASPRLLLPLDFGLFGLGPEAVVTGIEITFLPTVGQADFSGAYIIVPPCGLFDLGQDTTICPGETVSIDATMPNATYLWQDGSTTPMYVDAGPGTYWVKVTIYDCSKTDTLHVTERSGPPPLGNDTALCTGETLLLDVTTNDAIYHWQNNTTLPTYTVTQAGQYSVTVTIADCMYTDEIEVDFMDPPIIDLGQDVILCEGETLTIDATTPNATYEWQDQSTSSLYDVTAPGTYAVTVDVAGCSSTDNVQVDYIYPEPIDLGSDITLCAGESIFLDAFKPGATYTWQDNATTSGYNVTAPGTYAVTVSTGQCSTTDEIEVDFLAAFDIDLGHDTILCSGETFLLNAATPNATYVWLDQSTTSTYNVTAAGIYTVDVIVDACTVRDTIDIGYVTMPVIELGPDTILCDGDTLLLGVSAIGATYQWQDLTTADTMVVTAPGRYWVNTLVNGCNTSDTIDVAYSSPPIVDLGNDTTICNAGLIYLDAQSPGSSYLWQDNSTEPTLAVTSPGLYWVTVINQTCSATDTIGINYTSIPSIQLGVDTTLCTGSTLLLDAGMNHAALEWQDQSTASTFLVTQPGSYWVKAYEGNCSTADTIEVDYLSLLSLDLGPDTTLCNDQIYFLDASIPGASYSWQDHSTSSTYSVTQPGQYWVDVSVGNCMVSDTIDVYFVVINTPDLGQDTILCEGEELLLNAGQPGASYQWQDNSVDQNFTVTVSGYYAVTVSHGACKASDTIRIDYHTLPEVDLGIDTTLCVGQSILLNVFTPGAMYEWQDHSTMPDYLVNSPGIYFVDLNDGLCKNRDSIRVAFLSISSIHLGNDTTLCADQLLTLQPNALGAQYLWQDNSTNPTYTVNSPGLFWVEVNVGSCLASDSIQIEIADTVLIDLGPDTTLCAGASILLEVSAPGASYEWNDHTILPTYIISQSGIYWVTGDVMGCKASDTISITYIDIPVEILGNDTALCNGDKLLLNAAVADALYTWQDQSTDSTLLVSDAGTYAVNVILHGCSARDTIQIEYALPTTFTLGVDRTICDGETLVLDPGLRDDLDFLWQDLSTSSTFVVHDAGEYWLQVNDDCGITADTISVAVDQCQCRLYFPNVFSPDGDQLNDVAIPVTSCGMISCRLNIFDRYGNLLFETYTIGKGWDGTTKSKPAQSGVYAYLLVYAFEDGIQRVMTGDLTLLR